MHYRENLKNLTLGAGGVNPSAGHKSIVRDYQEILMKIVRDCLEKLEILKFLIKAILVVTDAMTRVDNNETGTVINVVEHESSFPEFEKDARQVEKIVTRAFCATGLAHWAALHLRPST